MTELLFDDEARELVIESQATVKPEMLALIERTTFGSGGTQYRVCDAENKLRLPANPHFVTLNKGGRLIGVYTLLGKEVYMDNHQRTAFYRTFLAVDASERGKGYGKLLVQKTRECFLNKLGSTGVLYGYIEADNDRSMYVAKNAGYVSLGTFRALVFSRVRPRDNNDVRLLQPDERAMLVMLLKEQYQDHALVDIDHSVNVDGYFVLEKNRTVLAGVQVEPCHWQVRRLPGASGFILVHVVSRVPYLRMFFNARQCRFLRLGNLYAQSGHESALVRLMEAVLARHQVNSAMTFQDPRSPVYRRIAQRGKFGLLNSRIDTLIHVMAMLKNFSAAQHDRCKQLPLFISPMDIG